MSESAASAAIPFGKTRSDGSHPEMDLLLSCARTQITPESASRIRSLVQKDIDWLALIRLAMRHDVMPLLHRNLQEVCPELLPDDISGPLRARYEAQAAYARRQAEELVRVLTAFAERGILAVPYKGPALAQRVYGDLSLRPFGDLDILIREGDVPGAQDLIRRLGYEFTSPSDGDDLPEYIRTNRELPFEHPNGTLIELQWRFASRLVSIKNDPERFLQRLQPIDLAGAQVPSLTLEAYVLILSLHATKHEWKQLKLVCDIAEILGRCDVDWKYVLREAQSLGLKRMLAVGAMLAKDSLGATIPADLARGLKIDRTAQSIAGQIRHGFSEQPKHTWQKWADFSFQLQIRERLRDKAGLLCRNFPTKLTPDENDRRFLPVPKSLSSVYYLVRPVRLAWEKWSGS